jgi:uracil-DNA glycosylase
MIIGQDWGPYKALLPYIKAYEERKDDPTFNYDQYLFETFSSRTEKFIIKSIEKTFYEKFQKEISQEVWNNFIFTIAVFFTRQGNHFRGNEFYDEKYGAEQSLPYLKRQIEIVQPKIIMPLGGTAWGMIREIFELNKYPKTISSTIEYLENKAINTNKITIIPNFHPASHTHPNIQYNLWKRVWEN